MCVFVWCVCVWYVVCVCIILEVHQCILTLNSSTISGSPSPSPTVEVIEEPEPFCRVAHLTYNPVRPTTARDFCILSYSAKVDPHTFVYSATSVSQLHAHNGCSTAVQYACTMYM